jgi:hypothetical protein
MKSLLFPGSVLGPVKCQGMSLLMPFGLDIDWALAPEKINVGTVNTARRGKRGP